MNLEVDVMDGDWFTKAGVSVFHYRGTKGRRIAIEFVGEWVYESLCGTEKPLDLPTFTRYCDGCGLTVKHVKPEPAVETIKPPEWAVVWPDGSFILMESEGKASSAVDKHAMREFKAKLVRIDWVAK